MGKPYLKRLPQLVRCCRLREALCPDQLLLTPVDVVARHATDCLNNHEWLFIGLVVVPAKVGRSEASLELEPEVYSRGIVL